MCMKCLAECLGIVENQQIAAFVTITIRFRGSKVLHESVLPTMGAESGNFPGAPLPTNTRDLAPSHMN